ncbi:hypothetical protein [Flavobacterium aestivum]|uniref:hypothetical protein n=1 Tax=Flavobacterium aestivum TaxID=3003257 RepID=UPI002286362D|nr:hypothetical protein [Flavobacterium aestivum]
MNGDFVVDGSEAQHVELILKSEQGQWKENPELGANLHKAKSGVIDRFLNRDIRVQLEADGFVLNDLTITPTGIEVIGNYDTTANT